MLALTNRSLNIYKKNAIMIHKGGCKLDFLYKIFQIYIQYYSLPINTLE